MSSYFSLHTHSRFSSLDGMTTPASLVETAYNLGQPALTLTDHGNMAGAVQLYKACKSHDMKPFIGIETYIIDPIYTNDLLDSAGSADRYHLGLVARSTRGYQGLVKYTSKTHTRPRFNRFPRATLDDLCEFLNEYGEDIVVTTGCVFGLIQGHLIKDGPERAGQLIETIKRYTPNLHIELQKHGIDDQQGHTENQIVDQMVEFADAYDLPIVITPDSHYTHQHEASAHTLMKTMVYQSGEDGFPGDTYHLPSAEWLAEKFSPEIWARAENAWGNLLDNHDLIIPALDTYHPHVPVVSKDADQDMKQQCVKALDKLSNLSGDKQVYLDRINEECRVIRNLGVANYFLFSKLGVDFCKNNGIAVEARGSANGSLVCYLLGLTTVDPIRYNTLFERFLSDDRITMPDIDFDISSRNRWQIIDYYNSIELNGVRYKTTQIGTVSMLGQNKDDDSDQGSVFRTYITYLKRKCQEEAEIIERRESELNETKYIKARADAKAKILWQQSSDSRIQSLEDIKREHPDDYEALKTIINMNSVTKSFGVHAGGILVSSDEVRIEDWIPTMLIASSDTTVTQYDMKDVEAFGLTKMDWLGQNSLDIMSDCAYMIGADDITDFSWIPDKDPATAKAMESKRFHTGTYHCEGSAKSKGTMELKPKGIKEYIWMQALYMPGAMNSGATKLFNARRKNPALMSQVPYTHPLLVDVFDWTFGVMVYQDQVLKTGRGIGMTAAQLQNFFKIVKDSGSGAVERNAIRLAEQKPMFVDLSTKAGLSDVEIDWVWDQIVAMGGYAFNLAHATGYGIRSYRSCYLKTHYPAEYMTALLKNWAGKSVKVYGKTKEQIYTEEAERLGYRPRNPKINLSTDTYTLDINPKNPVIRKGLTSIKGVGAKAAEELAAHAPYTSMEDLIDRVDGRKVTGGKNWKKDGTLTGVLEKLYVLDVLDFT